jgi:hypothetical protein
VVRQDWWAQSINPKLELPNRQVCELQTPLFNRTCGEAGSVDESRTQPFAGRAGVNRA